LTPGFPGPVGTARHEYSPPPRNPQLPLDAGVAGSQVAAGGPTNLSEQPEARPVTERPAYGAAVSAPPTRGSPGELGAQSTAHGAQRLSVTPGTPPLSASRDKGVFQHLERDVLPALAHLAMERGETTLACWSLGCASGEEPYTVAILWRLRVAPHSPRLRCWIPATDADGEAIRRAERACYSGSSPKDVPPDWIAEAFTHAPEGFGVKPEYRALVSLQRHDIRTALPEDRFHIVLCRNVVFTYFDEKASTAAEYPEPVPISRARSPALGAIAAIMNATT
jgi:hypothetical protein